MPLLFFAGMMFLQVAWLLAVPPFGGSDEFDHAYRAASVAEGYWADWQTPADGRGELIPVPRSIVVDAQEICSSYEYTGPDNCRAVTDLDNGLVTVASAAARYNPVFYWVVGTPSRLFEGARALYVMRFVGALLCALLIAVAAWTVTRWARTRWPLISLVVCLTPIMMYTTAVAAPNGVEMAGALCLWVAILGLATEKGREHARSLLVVSTIGASVLATVRMLGPMWLCLILCIGAISIGRPGLAALWRSDRRSLMVSGAVIGMAGAGGLGWTLFAKTNTAVDRIDGSAVSPWGPTLTQVPVWFFQSIAAFPLRNQHAPTVVYACAGLVLLTLVSFAVYGSGSRDRLLITSVAFLALAIPFAFSITTAQLIGLVWQGRYTLPFAFGVVLLSGAALDKRGFTHRLVRPAVFVGYLCVTVAHTVSIVSVQLGEERNSPLFQDPRWIMAPSALVGVIALIGVAVWFFATDQPEAHQEDTVASSPAVAV